MDFWAEFLLRNASGHHCSDLPARSLLTPDHSGLCTRGGEFAKISSSGTFPGFRSVVRSSADALGGTTILSEPHSLAAPSVFRALAEKKKHLGSREEKLIRGKYDLLSTPLSLQSFGSASYTSCLSARHSKWKLHPVSCPAHWAPHRLYLHPGHLWSRSDAAHFGGWWSMEPVRKPSLHPNRPWDDLITFRC